MEKRKTAKKAQTAEVKHAEHESQDVMPKVIIKGKPLSLRGQRFEGTVVADKMSKTVTVEWEGQKYIPKFQRYEKRRTRVKAHDELGVKVGDKVEIIETRPISKTKNFLVVKRIQ